MLCCFHGCFVRVLVHGGIVYYSLLPPQVISKLNSDESRAREVVPDAEAKIDEGTFSHGRDCRENLLTR
jgi:hypothetical protein